MWLEISAGLFILVLIFLLRIGVCRKIGVSVVTLPRGEILYRSVQSSYRNLETHFHDTTELIMKYDTTELIMKFKHVKHAF